MNDEHDHGSDEHAATFDDFKNSFFYGSRSDLNLKFMAELDTIVAAKFVQEMLTGVTELLDGGDPADLIEQFIEWQRRTYSSHSDLAARFARAQEQCEAAIAEGDVELAAQNMSQHPAGAYTGEISARMIKECGCRHVILGHSERRSIYGETNAVINAKVLAALEARLHPILCIGETLAERDAGPEAVKGRCRCGHGHVGLRCRSGKVASRGGGGTKAGGDRKRGRGKVFDVHV